MHIHILFNFTLAYNIYTIIRGFGQAECRETRDEALKALNKMKEAEANYDEILANVTSAKEEMDKVRGTTNKNSNIRV